jgi:hypothetical protein
LREKHRLRLVANRVLMKIFGYKTDEVTVEWRRLHSEELYDKYCLPNIIRMIKWRRMRRVGHAARMRDRKGAYRGLVGRPDGKKPPRRPGSRWENNIKILL